MSNFIWNTLCGLTSLLTSLSPRWDESVFILKMNEQLEGKSKKKKRKGEQMTEKQ